MEPYKPYPLALVAELVDLLRERENATRETTSPDGVQPRWSEDVANGSANDVRNGRISVLVGRLTRLRSPHEDDVVAGAKLLSRIDEGEFGHVWRARELQTGETCAVKIFHPHRLGEGAMVREFRQGVAAMRLLTEKRPPPSIVRLINADDAQLAFSMSYIDGSDLRDIFRRGWTLEKKIRVFQVLCEAVRFAHQNEVIHRDIKPANVLIDKKGNPVLTDFDLADLLTLGTLTGRAVGSLAYAAPEQIDAKLGRKFGTRLLESDIYSLGRMLFYMVTESEPAVLDRGPDIPELRECEGLRRIVRRCTIEDPSRRYASVDELLAHLRIYASKPLAVGTGPNDWAEAHAPQIVLPQAPGKAGSHWGMATATIVAALITGACMLLAALLPRAAEGGPDATSPAPAPMPSVRTVPTGIPSSSSPPKPRASSVYELSAKERRRSAWFAHGIGSHFEGQATRPVWERKLSLRANQFQLGSFVCEVQFNDWGDPVLLRACQGRGGARVKVPLDLPVSCKDHDDREWTYCWSSSIFTYGVGPQTKTGRFSMALPLSKIE